MVCRLILPLCEKDGFVDLGQFLAEVLSQKSAVHSEPLGKLSNILDVEPL